MNKLNKYFPPRHEEFSITWTQKYPGSWLFSLKGLGPRLMRPSHTLVVDLAVSYRLFLDTIDPIDDKLRYNGEEINIIKANWETKTVILMYDSQVIYTNAPE